MKRTPWMGTVVALVPKPELPEQLVLPRSMWYKLKSSTGCEDYRVMKGKREMPGNHMRGKNKEKCGPNPRVKITLPGVYRRECGTCGAVYWFKLEQTQTWGVLRFRWIDEEELNEYLSAEAEGTTEGISDSGREDGRTVEHGTSLGGHP